MNFMRDIICFGIIVLISFSSVNAADFISRDNLKQFDGIIIKNKSAYEVYDKVKEKNKKRKDLYSIQKKVLEPYVYVLVNVMETYIKQIKDSDFSLSCSNSGNQICKLIVSTENYYNYGGNIVYACSCGRDWTEHKFHFAEDKQSETIATGNLKIDRDIAMGKFLASLNKSEPLKKDKIKEILRRYGVEV